MLLLTCNAFQLGCQTQPAAFRLPENLLYIALV